MGRVAQATTINQVLTDLGDLRQDVERLRRTARGASQQDALSEAAAWKAACSVMQGLPGLRGFWPMSSFNEGGDAYDLSGQGRTMSYNGDPTYNYDGLAPYIDLDGTGDYLSRADEAGLDILGTESYVAAGVRGLTCGGWFFFDNAPGAQEAIFNKSHGGGVAQIAYWLARQAGGQAAFRLSDGAALQGPTSTTVMVASTWYFVAGRFIPSATADLYVDAEESTDAAGIPANLINSTGPLNIGSYNNGAGAMMTGRASLCFLCVAQHSDALVRALFAATRGLFRKW